MEEWKDAEVDVIVGKIVDDGVEHVPADLAMTDLSAFGQSGGAAGEQQASDVFFMQRFASDRRAGRLVDDGLVEEGTVDAITFSMQISG